MDPELLKTSLQSKLSRVQGKERLRTDKIRQLEERRERKQQLQFNKRRDDEDFPGLSDVTLES